MPSYLATNKPEFCWWLCHFVLEVRQQDGAEYPKFTSSSLLWHSAPKHAKPITHNDEEKMWSQGVLGDSTPKQLVETIIYMCGLYFTVRCETEHYNLRDGDIEIVEWPGQTEHVIHNESSSKNNLGDWSKKNQAKTGGLIIMQMLAILIAASFTFVRNIVSTDLVTAWPMMHFNILLLCPLQMEKCGLRPLLWGSTQYGLLWEICVPGVEWKDTTVAVM